MTSNGQTFIVDQFQLKVFSYVFSDTHVLFRYDDIWMHGTKVVLSLLILTLLMALTGGVVKTFADLYLLFSQPLEVIFRTIIVNTLLLLAIVEVLKTTVTYFSEGRVKVTFIVDTILVVMLTEVISQWFKDASLERWLTLGGILLALAILRVVAVRWSPAKCDSAPEGLPTPNTLSISGA